MRIDWSRLIVFMLVALLGQRLIYMFINYLALNTSLGYFSGGIIALITLKNILVGFLFALLYLRSDERKGCFKRREFYKNVGIFTAIFMLFDVIGMI